MKTNTIQWEILEDGTISITTDDLAGPNHHSADELLKQLSKAVGGTTTIKRRNKFHVHEGTHSHSHGGQVHQH